jgi:para-nitrobenzyl esterase
MSDSTIVTTSEGTLRGQLDEGLAVFRNVPFASPPTGALRFMPPLPPRPWSDVRDAFENGPICPQLPARLAPLMGPIESAQDEDCLTLTICAPEPREHSRPVLVWFHGGGYASGAGSLPWYSGERIARESDVVVVGVNYRVGALGYLFHPALVAGNMGLLDQIAALKWIRRNIAHFGGDAERIVLIGQSGGAHSITCLMAMPETRPLVRRAIFLSTPFGMRTIPAESATQSAAVFLDVLKIDPAKADALERLQQAPVAAILEAQLAVMRRPWRPAGDPTPPFGPTAVGDLPGGAEFEQAVLTGASNIEAMLGTTRDEMTPFYVQDPRIQNAQPGSLPGLAENLFGDAAVQRIEMARRHRPGGTDLQAFCDAQNFHYFVEGMCRLASAIATAGRNAWIYQFDWPSPNPVWGACHCIELPFIFGSWQEFGRAPMLGETGPTAEALSRVIRQAIGRFVSTGDPNGLQLPQWRAFDEKTRAVLHFDSMLSVHRAPELSFDASLQRTVARR